jgi:hypothetical protein
MVYGIESAMYIISVTYLKLSPNPLFFVTKATGYRNIHL